MTEISITEERVRRCKVFNGNNQKVKKSPTRRADGGKLKVSASDAYTAGLTSMPCSSEVGDVSFYVVYSAARTLAKLKGKEVKIGVNAQGENWYTRFIIDC